jgi:hypothetical protein
LVRCLFLLCFLFLCVAYAAEASFDKKGLLEAVHNHNLVLKRHSTLSGKTVRKTNVRLIE